jgi:hypothetical protein
MFAWLIYGLLGFLAFREFLGINILVYVSTENLLHSRRFLMFLLTSFISLSLWIGFYFLILRKERELTLPLLNNIPPSFKHIISVLLILFPALLKWIIPLPENFNLEAWIMVFLFYSFSLFAVSVIGKREAIQQRFLWIGVFFMLGGVCYAIFAKLNLVTAYPFTTFWSEGNRFFDYSTLFGSYRYNFETGEKIKAFTNWGMQLPWAVPFIFPNLSIGAFRLWNQLVWIIPSLLLGFLSINKEKKNKTSFIAALIFACWAFLFLDQGPIYAPLIIAAILTVIAVRVPLTPGFFLILIASYYAGSARWTWSYAPGIWAGLLSLLVIDNPSFKKDMLKELVKPVSLGIAGYIGGQLLPSIIRMFTSQSQIAFLPNPIASTTRQPLLWNRLYPNPTYPPGILLGLVWAALPLLLFLIILLLKKSWKISWMQAVSIVVVTAVFLTVGVIASTKIGGGSNLHNLDMFLVSLTLIASAAINYLLTHETKTKLQHYLAAITLLIALIAPVTYTLQNDERMVLPPDVRTNEAMSAVKNKIMEYSSQGEILFIDHRQLLTFGLVENVPLIDEYEKKYLMDFAMAANEDYFHAFYKDISSHRFVLIVNEPINIISRGLEYSFGEENDAYVKWVTAPLLCAYEPLYTSQATALELLVPRTSPPPDTLPCEDIFSFIDN